MTEETIITVVVVIVFALVILAVALHSEDRKR